MHYQQWLTHENARAFVISILRRGVFGRQRRSYGKFPLTAATRYRRCFDAAMTLAVMGHHFQVMTSRLLETVEEPILPPAIEKGLTEEAD